MSGDPDSPRATGVAPQASNLAPVAQLERRSVAALRSCLERHDYHVDEVVERLGPPAHAALARNQALPGERALGGADDPLSTMIRLWLLQRPVTAAAAQHALPDLLGPLTAANLLARDGDEVRALVDIRPYDGDDGVRGWVAADLTPGMDGRIDRVADDYVLGVSPASTTLTQLAARTPVGTAFDLGTGCGVQSLHLARHAERVVATDVNQRALHLAELSLALNRVTNVELRHGSLYEPLGDLRFDQVISNPPYVMAPPSTAHLTYREQGLPGDQLVREVVTGAARRLNPGGTAQVLANWAHPADGDWAERLTTWVADTGCDLHVVQREVLDPAEYVELWLADAGLVATSGYRRAYAAWLDHLSAIGVAAIGMGWIFLANSGRAVPELVVEHWPHPVAQPVGPDVARWPSRSRLAHLPETELLALRLVLAPDVAQVATGRPGEPDPYTLELQQQQGLRRTVTCDTALAGAVGACDGELSLGVIIDAVARLLDRDPRELTDEMLPSIRNLVREGLLTALSQAGRPLGSGTRTNNLVTA